VSGPRPGGLPGLTDAEAAAFLAAIDKSGPDVDRAAAAARLRTVGGVYDYVAEFVDRDTSDPPASGVESRHD